MTLVWLSLTMGLAPLLAGVAILGPAIAGADRAPRAVATSALLCALCFNLTFIWQEFWLVVPKALTPGLHPILYHNDHDWTGHNPLAELLQGCGAIATLASGLAFLGVSRLRTQAPRTWRLFVFWMAFQGLYQSLVQFAIGTVIPGNDLGRALAYLHVSGQGRLAILCLAVMAMALAGCALAGAYPAAHAPAGPARDRNLAFEAVTPALLAIILVVPFRLPRSLVEVALVPALVNLIGAGWLVLGAAITPPARNPPGPATSTIVWPALALGALLLLFQLVLRRGIAF
jgi:hypothetical protein